MIRQRHRLVGLCACLSVALLATAGGNSLSAQTAEQAYDGFKLRYDAYVSQQLRADANDKHFLGSLRRVSSNDKFTSLKGILKQFEIAPKIFQQRDNDSQTSLGFSYDLDQALWISSEKNLSSLNFIARGNVAFDQSDNPNDFLETGFRFLFFGSDPYGEERIEGVEAPTLSEFGAEFNKQAPQLARYNSVDQIYASEEYKSLVRSFTNDYLQRLEPHFFWQLQGHIQFESEQDFSSNQFVVGAEYGGVYKDRRPTPNFWNIFDYPAAALRWLAGGEFSPSRAAWPSVRLGLDAVNPADNESRQHVDNGSYLRFRGEFAMRTPLFEMMEEMTHLAVSYRWYRQVGPSSIIQRADLDHQELLRLQFDLPRNFFLSYTNGKLPLDSRDDTVLEFGWNFSF